MKKLISALLLLTSFHSFADTDGCGFGGNDSEITLVDALNNANYNAYKVTLNLESAVRVEKNESKGMSSSGVKAYISSPFSETEFVTKFIITDSHQGLFYSVQSENVESLMLEQGLQGNYAAQLKGKAFLLICGPK